MATVEDVEVDAASGAALALATGSASRPAPAMAIAQTAPRARPKVWRLTVIRRIIWRPASCAAVPLQAGAAGGCGPPGPASSVRGATLWAGFTREAEAAYL